MRFLSILLALACVLLHADESAPSPGGKSITISGDITHHKTPAEVKVEGAPDDGSYNEEVSGSSFTAKVEGLPAGTYTIEIDFAETHYNAPGNRLMRITCGNAVLADNLDLLAVAGFAKAYKLVAKVDHQDDTILGPLAITFTGTKDQAKFNAIHVLDAQGHEVAKVKAGDLVNTADASSSKIPEVAGPVIYTDPDQPTDLRIDDLIRRMSLSEKVSQLINDAVAIPRLNVPAYNYWNECLHGVARDGAATVFPEPIGLAATWDEEKMRQAGQVIATEARAKYNKAESQNQHGAYHGLNFWAPNINIFRDPRWGRGQETYGEDPFLTARIAVNFIEGIQGDDPKYLKAMACAKHFAVHSGPEHGRGSFNVNPDARDLYETYLPQFQAAVQEAQVGAVMASYNSIYNVPNACNPWLLTDLLRNTWGFKGHVVSDCGAVSHIVGEHRYAETFAEGDADAINAGLDLECGGSFRALTESVAEGLVKEKQIDTALHRVLKVRFDLGLFDPPARVPFSNIPITEVESPEHLALARTLARESMVLLKNDHVLPLSKEKLKRIAVIGPNAMTYLNGNYAGSPTNPISVLQGIQQEVGPAVKVDYFKGCPLTHDPVHPENDVSPEDYQKTLEAAKSADVIIYVGGLGDKLEGEENHYVSEGFSRGDRTSIELPAVQEKLLHDLRDTGRPVVFVNCTGSAVAMPWVAAHVPAILQAWYPGGQGGAAVADVLFGHYNPSGRLPITFYEKTADLPDYYDYRMANRTYRYFTGKALFPFGFGLSYTTFEYQAVAPAQATVAATDTLHLTLPIKNTGTCDGDEIVQVYLRHIDSPVPQSIRSLIAFKRVTMPKGGTTQVNFDIPVERVHYWSVEKKAYVVDQGHYEIQVGASSNDIRQTCAVTVQ
jgi:beta-glucosidase